MAFPPDVVCMTLCQSALKFIFHGPPFQFDGFRNSLGEEDKDVRNGKRTRQEIHVSTAPGIIRQYRARTSALATEVSTGSHSPRYFFDDLCFCQFKSMLVGASPQVDARLKLESVELGMKQCMKYQVAHCQGPIKFRSLIRV